MFDSMTRKELDQRNSVDREEDIYDESAIEYNDPEWAPTTYVLVNLHSKFTTAMTLELPPNAVVMTPEMAKKIIKDLLSSFKRAYNNWKASGNGRYSKAKEGETVRLLVSGTDYEDDVEDDEGGRVVIRHCDDDRFNFCNDIALAYFWGLLEMFSLTSFGMQNVSLWGLADGKAPAARDRARAPKKTSQSEESRRMISKAIAELPIAMQNMNCYLSNEQQQKKMTSAEDQYRRSLALFQLASKDHNKALLDEAMYNAQPSSLEAVSEIHAQNVKEMFLQKEETKRDFDRCKRRRNELLGVEMAAEEEKVEEMIAEEEVVEVDSSSDSSSSSSSSTSSHDDSNSEDEDEEEEQDWTASPADDDVSELVSDLKSSVEDAE